MYKAIVLDQKSQKWLRDNVRSEDVDVLCHHITICMGSDSKRKYPFEVGEVVTVTVEKLGWCLAKDLPEKQRAKLPDTTNDYTILAMCIGVKLPDGKHVKNDIPHVTLTVDREAGGKPMHSNYCSKWTDMHGCLGATLTGTVRLCE